MTQNIYITDLERALNDVDSSFVTFDTYIGLSKDENISDSPFFSSMLNEPYVDDYILQFLENQKQLKEHSLERNFCYQLYFTWMTIIKRNNNKTYDSLKLNGEVSKTNLTLALKSYPRLKNSALFEKIKANGLLEKTYFVPDLVLHGGQDDVNNQKLIVEVKYGDNLKNGNFETDFYKLAVYQKIFQFTDSVFLIVNITIKDLLEYLKKVDTTLVAKTGLWFMIKSEQKIYTFNLNDLV
ncbi:hypothetical protein [Paludibacter sp.]|uniref:hypothetical protein n=1 Tax=Paludibacter sp. TaxID=1898105 RepID=UPI0013552E83|nr:hypothetical protein [Paludibacter sp.]MTK53624.1 hypothetical protein [Paludibacter sp.]